MNQYKQKQTQIEHYNWEAGIYDEKYKRDNRCNQKKIKYIFESLQLRPNDTVLEVGVGTGLHAKWLLEINPALNLYFIGCDLSVGMIKQAEKNLQGFPGVSFLIAPAENIPLPTASVDKAYMNGMIHHVGNRRKSVEELIRIVKKEGIIVISEPNIFNPLTLWAGLTQYKIEKGVFFNTPRNLRQLFSGLPVEIIDHKLFNFTPPRPKFMSKYFDKIDSFFEKTQPPIRYIASMNLLVLKRK